ncbi:RPAB5 [Hepatospora eriocheir]|uniref:DNA-directed RNA polymerases I, II, and III subunit RPABC5 n=1 Tax=Hepatospora eriocheir TaxID=1081669 RepID=A0A1X0QES8_9MICR|nr:RPAB5 [Hepatospora eriocheir]ORD98287.1 RPAB5 [Hepatospora eriocheir]ORD98941.1 RPAB5 [Hepatospora eriocheir]
MIIPVRCFTCGKEISSRFEEFTQLKESNMRAGEALDILGMKRYCCRRMFLGHVDLSERLLEFETTNKNTESNL